MTIVYKYKGEQKNEVECKRLYDEDPIYIQLVISDFESLWLVRAELDYIKFCARYQEVKS